MLPYHTRHPSPTATPSQTRAPSLPIIPTSTTQVPTPNPRIRYIGNQQPSSSNLHSRSSRLPHPAAHLPIRYRRRELYLVTSFTQHLPTLPCGFIPRAQVEPMFRYPPPIFQSSNRHGNLDSWAWMLKQHEGKSGGPPSSSINKKCPVSAKHGNGVKLLPVVYLVW